MTILREREGLFEWASVWAVAEIMVGGDGELQVRCWIAVRNPANPGENSTSRIDWQSEVRSIQKTRENIDS